jgi:CRISPR-associated protein (TIGR03984 family)
MMINYELIKAAFPRKAWAYAEGFDSVKIGKWNGAELVFAEPLEEDYLTELRVFDSNRELKFTGEKTCDTARYSERDFIPELSDTQYFMYGEHAETLGDYTALSEDRGGAILFPAKLDFPKTIVLPDGAVGLKLGIKNFVRYNPVPVLPKGKDYDFGLSTSGAGALEVIDYAYTGFFYENGKAVEL